jgi:glutathione S-transferase
MLHIYGVPVSVLTRKVIVAAIHKGLPYQLTPVVPVIPGNPPPNWRSLSPTGLIPVATHGDFTLADSSAICDYLERTQPTPPIYSADPRGHARALWFEQYAGTLFRDVVRPLFHELVVHPKVRQIPTDQAKVDTILRESAPEMFRYLDSVARDGFLAGPSMTMADVAVVSNLVNLSYIGFGAELKAYANLAALFEQVIGQPSMRKALQGETEGVQAMGLDNRDVRQVLA